MFSVYPLPNLTHLRFNEWLFEDREVNLTTLPRLTHFVLSDCYNIASGITIPDGTTLKSLELSAGNRDIQTNVNDRVFNHDVSSDFPLILNSFQGLEVMIIDAKVSQMSDQICIDLAYAAQRQSKTLRALICQYGLLRVLWNPHRLRVASSNTSSNVKIFPSCAWRLILFSTKRRKLKIYWKVFRA